MPAADNVQWRKNGTVPGGTNGDALMRHADVSKVSVAVYPATSAKVQITVSPPQTVIDGAAVWFDWALGTVLVDSIDSIDVPFTAIRVVSVAGDTDFDIVGE